MRAFVLLLVGCGRIGFDAQSRDAAAVTDDIVVPLRPFLMGCNDAIDPDCDSHELPGHVVTLTIPYAIDRTEVTQVAYAACIDAGACTPPASDFDPMGSAQLPVRAVSWDQASTYCAWRGKRLPTEAEWELAARGDDGRLYPWGNTPPDCTLVNFSDCGGVTPFAVGSLPAGASWVGALDMSGNVWEWVNDVFDSSYYETSPAVDPTGPATGTAHGTRGGYYNNSPPNIRASSRAFFDPAGYLGFRCARSL